METEHKKCRINSGAFFLPKDNWIGFQIKITFAAV